jgi:hypothetical protein
MTRDEMKAKLADALEEAAIGVNGWTTTSDRKLVRSLATAVLYLCGPKPLEWDYVSNTQTWQAKSGLGEYSVGFDDGWWGELIGNIQWEWEPDCDPRTYYGPDAAQSAAQAHADAAHWANTPMGD